MLLFRFSEEDRQFNADKNSHNQSAKICTTVDGSVSKETLQECAGKLIEEINEKRKENTQLIEDFKRSQMQAVGFVDFVTYVMVVYTRTFCCVYIGSCTPFYIATSNSKYTTKMVVFRLMTSVSVWKIISLQHTLKTIPSFKTRSDNSLKLSKESLSWSWS